MATTTDEMILNWSGTLRKSRDGERAVIASAVSGYQARGIAAQQAEDMLLADRYSQDLIQECLASAYAEAAPVRQASVALAPTSYADVRPTIERSLATQGPSAFVDALTASAAPIVRTSKKHVDSLRRLAECAHGEIKAAHRLTPALDALHAEIEPYVCNAMCESVILAEKQGKVHRIASRGKDHYRVTTARETADVDLARGVSTGARFSGGKFAMFGLADEHIVRAAATAHPFERLKRAISEA